MTTQLQEEMARGYSVENWLQASEIENAYSSSYWNDESIELKKICYHVLENGFDKMEHRLARGGELEQIQQTMGLARKTFGYAARGKGIDLAAGILWAAPSLLNIPEVTELWCLEFSRHRLLKLGPAVLQHYQIPLEKIKLILGSFYEVRVPDKTFDFVFLSAAFHHADEPERLLKEITRILKDDGLVFVIGEHDKSFLKDAPRYLARQTLARLPPPAQKRILGRVLRRQGWLPTKETLCMTDTVSGDHYYFMEDYRHLFANAGFQFVSLKFKRAQLGFVLKKRQ